MVSKNISKSRYHKYNKENEVIMPQGGWIGSVHYLTVVKEKKRRSIFNALNTVPLVNGYLDMCPKSTYLNFRKPFSCSKIPRICYCNSAPLSEFVMRPFTYQSIDMFHSC